MTHNVPAAESFTVRRRGPVSEVLLGELKELVRQRGLVVWLDSSNTYTRFADALTAADVCPVVRYRGSFARVLRQAAPHAREVTPTPLLVHLAGLDEKTVLRTPALELAAAGHRWTRDLQALVTTAAAGRVRPDALAEYVAQATTLEQADAWLADRLEEAGGGLSTVLRAMSLAEIVHQLVDMKDSPIAARVAHAADLKEIWAHLNRRTGLPEDWWKRLEPPDGRFSRQDVAFALAGWALCVEYIHDPAPRVPKAPALLDVPRLPAEVVVACRTLAQALRQREDLFYQSTADETEARISEETSSDPSTLGLIDTFRFEEDALLKAGIAQLDPASARPEAWDRVLGWAEGREARSFWLRRDEKRKMAWRLVLDAARLAQAIAVAGSRLPRSLDLAGAVEWYVQAGARVDQLHRVLEQDCSLLLKSELPEYEALGRAVVNVRAAWTTWARSIAQDFSALCQREGFLPEPRLQQRTLFDDVLDGAEGAVTAYFMVDGLRYEMANALRSMLDGSGTTTQLHARLAELPTITDIGMNVLAPVVRGGKLAPVLSDQELKGFQVGEYRVRDTKTRQRAIQDRVGGATCPKMSLKEVVADTPSTLRQRISRARVVYVYSEEIDKAGHSGLGLTTFESTLVELREAWLRLREAGVRRFVFTADHGFLLLDRPHTIEHGPRFMASERHVFSSVAVDLPDEVRLPLASLGYEGVDGFLTMPAALQVFATGSGLHTFVHGGNSLQERVIPVLVVQSKAEPGSRRYKYEVHVAPASPVPGMHRIVVTVALAPDQLFGGERQVDVVLRPLEVKGVSIDVWVGSELAEGKLRVVVGQATEVFFRLLGETADRVAVEVACAGDVQAQPVVAGFFAVEPTKKPTGKAAAALGGGGMLQWLESVENTGHRQVLAHLAAHGSISEPEVAAMLGSPAHGRRFARALDELVPPTAPMQVRVDSLDGVKRYVREDG